MNWTSNPKCSFGLCQEPASRQLGEEYGYNWRCDEHCPSREEQAGRRREVDRRREEDRRTALWLGGMSLVDIYGGRK